MRMSGMVSREKFNTWKDDHNRGINNIVANISGTNP